METINNKAYYVYYHKDPRNNQVKYIGCGSGHRAYELNTRNNLHKQWRRELESLCLMISIEIVRYYNTKKEALREETRLIKEFSAKEAQLFNIIHTDKDKNFRAKLIGSKNPMFRKKRPDLSIRNSHNKGKTFEQIYGIDKTLEIKKKLSKPGVNNPMFRKKRPDLSIRNLSFKGKTQDEIYGVEKSNQIRIKKGGVVIVTNNGQIFYSLRKAELITGCSRYLIKECLKDINRTCKGYTFQYLIEQSNITSQS